MVEGDDVDATRRPADAERNEVLPVYDHLSYPDFLAKHLAPNTPFLLSSKATASWPARTDWVRADGSPNLDGLRRYADQVVPVADTLRPEYSEFQRSDRTLGEILDLWREGGGQGLYVKDWHLLAEIERGGRGVGEVYSVPECFRDDWLNPPYTPDRNPSHLMSESTDGDGDSDGGTTTSDFRFTYLGPAGTYTPLHRDVYSSYSWSVNVAGRKMWWLFPPREEVWARILKNGEPVFDVRDLSGEGGGIKVVQYPGQVIWVPSGWYHQVLNLDFCISINHNFFSSATLPRIYSALTASQARVEESIADVREMIIHRLGTHSGEWETEWAGEVQALLERDAGWGWAGFWACVKRNLTNPPLGTVVAPASRRAGAEKHVRDVLRQYKLRREYDLLLEVRRTVTDIEHLLDAS